jgi:hypothetical protein
MQLSEGCAMQTYPMPRGEVPGQERNLAERLERGEVIYYPLCPFPLPIGDDAIFLAQQRLASRAHKNISLDPHTGKATGFERRSAEQEGRLRRILADFSIQCTAWLSVTLPRYARGWQLDRATFRSEEEATRRLRLTARNDLLHVDAFPSRPTNGKRLLRVFVNVHPNDPRVWMTSDSFPVLFECYGQEAGLPGQYRERWSKRFLSAVTRLLCTSHPYRTPYDSFMLRFHDFLKRNEEFQEKCPKRFWSFPPGSAWMCFTDTVSHAVLRGRCALEHSYFVPQEHLSLRQESPAAIVARRLPVAGRLAVAA